MNIFIVFACCLAVAVQGIPVSPAAVPEPSGPAVNASTDVLPVVNATAVVPLANATILPVPAVVNETAVKPAGNMSTFSSNSSEVPVDIFIKANFTDEVPVIDFFIMPFPVGFDADADADHQREARFLGGGGLGLGLAGLGGGYDGFNGGYGGLGGLGGLRGGGLGGLGGGLGGLGLLGGRNRANSNANAISNAGPFGTAISTANSNAVAGNGLGGGGLFRKRRSSPPALGSDDLQLVIDPNNSAVKTSNLVNNALFGTVQNVLSNTGKTGRKP